MPQNSSILALVNIFLGIKLRSQSEGQRTFIKGELKMRKCRNFSSAAQISGGWVVNSDAERFSSGQPLSSTDKIGIIFGSCKFITSLFSSKLRRYFFRAKLKPVRYETTTKILALKDRNGRVVSLFYSIFICKQSSGLEYLRPRFLKWSQMALLDIFGTC